MTRRVGLLGGTFDPPHLGHLVVAECARVELELDEVRLLVAGDPWMKSTTSPAADRVAMVRPPSRTTTSRRRPGGGPRGADLHRRHPRRAPAEEPDVDWWFVLGEDAAAGLSDAGTASRRRSRWPPSWS
jgi:nicotinate-nucleotide adenylyltransferase